MKSIIIVLFFSIFLVSCSQPAPTPDPALFAAQTEIAQIKVQLSEKEAELIDVLGQYHWLQSATPETIIQVITVTFT